MGWIDFEKEIAKVINEFEKAISDKEENKYLYRRNREQVRSNSFNYIIQQFDFFFNSINHQKPYIIKDEYVIETPFGSNIYSINKEKIISDLFASLKELTQALKVYLSVFVEKPLKKMIEKGIIELNESFRDFNEVLTFNYTNTYEMLYDETSMHFIHGQLDSDIILGVNPDESDELNELDNSFIAFKKYYQRIVYRTDNSFIKKINDIKENRGMLHPEQNDLVVCGHSLDITDQDIIKEVFDISDKIYIVCYKLDEIGKYVSNLIKIYGKKEFDIIRSKKHLQFITYQELESVEYTENFVVQT